MEIWKDIIGFDGAYQISNKGNVRSLDRQQKNSKGNTVHYKGKFLKQQPNSQGYMRIELKTKNKKERWFVHRLVAVHFVDNPLPEINTVVNHLDNNYLNNSADNLEWTTLCGNSQHALMSGRMKRTEKWLSKLHKSLEKYQKAVIGYDPKTGESIVIFRSINECGRCGYEASCVCDCCKGKRKTHRGLAWKYANDEQEIN